MLIRAREGFGEDMDVPFTGEVSEECGGGVGADRDDRSPGRSGGPGHVVGVRGTSTPHGNRKLTV
jgi:hypothetical protein